MRKSGMTSRAAIILSGGKARRFQSEGANWLDKAFVELKGKPLLIHAIKNFTSIVDEIAVCVNDEQRKEKYRKILDEQSLTNIKIVVDKKISHISGPNLAIFSGLTAVEADYCFTLHCDMPFLQPAVAAYMFKEASGFDVAVPMWPNGRLETLTMVLKRQTALEITETLCRLKRPRSDDIPRGANRLLLVSPVNKVKMIDPELQSFININSKEDLTRLQTRISHGPVKENLPLNLGVASTSDLKLLRDCTKMLQERKLSEAHSTFGSCAGNFEVTHSYFWAAISCENQGEALLKLSQQQSEPAAATKLDFEGKEAFVRAANNYRVEAEMYLENRCMLLAERACADKAWCESWAMGKAGHVHRYSPKYHKRA